MAPKKNLVTGLDINANSICMARCIPDDKLVSNVSIQPLDLNDNVEYWETVKAGLKNLEAQIKFSGENVSASLPGEFAIIKVLFLDEDEPDIQEALEWEFSQQITGSLEDYVYDYQLLSNQDEPGVKKYLVVGYRVSNVDNLTKLLKDVKLQPRAIDLDVFAMVNIFELNYKDLFNDPTIIILGTYTKSKFILTCKGEFIDIDIVQHDANSLTPQEYPQIVDDAFSRIRKYNTKTFNQGTVQILYTGSLFAENEFSTQMQQMVPGAQMLYPFRNITCNAGMTEDDLKKYSPQLSVAVGLALGGAVQDTNDTN